MYDCSFLFLLFKLPQVTLPAHETKQQLFPKMLSRSIYNL